jgi:hypothetical protein
MAKNVGGRPRQPQICCSSRCLREIQPHEKAVGLSFFAQTLGMGKRRTSKSQRLFLCPECAYRTASPEREPPKTAPFDVAIFKVLLDLVGADPDVAQAGWEQMKQRREMILYQAALPAGQGEVLPPERTLRAG